jgi:septal ring-binding cell division protein DamX
MSDEREESLPRRRTGPAGGWKDLASSALLIGAVLAILITGFVLKSERAPDAAVRGAPPLESPVLGSTIVPETVPESSAPPAAEPAAALPVTAHHVDAPAPPSDPMLEGLATRAAADLSRLSASANPWTAQLLVACRTETVERVITSSRGASQLYVLPAEVKGEACFRVCWGTYRSQKDATAAADLPKELRGKDRIGAVEIAKVAP